MGAKVSQQPMQVTPTFTLRDLSEAIPAPVIQVNVPPQTEQVEAITRLADAVSKRRPELSAWDFEVTVRDRNGFIQKLTAIPRSS
jgi:hypothetical protein